jgi:hypothetical protein
MPSTTPGVENAVGLQPDGAGKKARTIEVVTVIDGVETTVQMQVLAIADGAGNVIDSFSDYTLQKQMVREIQLLRSVIERWLGTASFDAPGHQETLNPT